MQNSVYLARQCHSAGQTPCHSRCPIGDKCLFPHHKVDEQPNKNPKKGYYSHNRRESDDKNAVAFEKIVAQLGCISQDSDALVSQRGKQNSSNSTVHSVYATSSKDPGKERTIA